MKLFVLWKKVLDFIRQNGAPSGLEKRGLDANINRKTRKPTEGTKEIVSKLRNFHRLAVYRLSN